MLEIQNQMNQIIRTKLYILQCMINRPLTNKDCKSNQRLKWLVLKNVYI